MGSGFLAAKGGLFCGLVNCKRDDFCRSAQGAPAAATIVVLVWGRVSQKWTSCVVRWSWRSSLASRERERPECARCVLVPVGIGVEKSNCRKVSTRVLTRAPSWHLTTNNGPLTTDSPAHPVRFPWTRCRHCVRALWGSL